MEEIKIKNHLLHTRRHYVSLPLLLQQKQVKTLANLYGSHKLLVAQVITH